jgi:hypothetical protein
MTCDYYTQIVLKILYKEYGIIKNICEFEERQPHYIWYDSDDENYDIDHNLPKKIVKNYGVKMLYYNTMWYCSKDIREHVEYLCSINNIDINNIISAEKYMTAWWCD